MKALKLNNYKIKFKANTGPYKHARVLAGLIAIILLTTIVFSSCKRSLTDGVVYTIGTSGFKYRAFVEVRDATNKNIAPGNLAVTISGPNANLVYDLTTGKRSLTINKNGTIQMLVSPNQPLPGPVSFNVSITSPGYIPAAKTITIAPTDSSQIIYIGLQTASSNIPAGGQVGVSQLALVNNALPHQTVIGIGADNTLHTVTDVSQPINNAVRKLNATGDGSTPATGVTYYDDNLTSIVLPQGTTFHYWVLEPTGVIISQTVDVPHTTATTSTTISGIVTGTITDYKTYYTQETITYPQTSWVQKTLSAAASTTDSIAVVVDYATGNNITTKISYGETVPTIHATLSNQDVLQDELLFNTVVSKKLVGNPVFYKIHHSTKKTWFDFTTNKQHTNETVPSYIVYDQVIYPDQTAQWFTSFAVNSAVINPNTHEPIKDGDQVEIGIDDKNTTITQTVKQVANGQLRVQMLSYDAGFFYKAPNIAPFDYTITPTTSVVDPENAIGYVSILGGACQFGFDGANSGAAINIQGKIASANSINTSASARATYWGNNVFNASYGLTATINPFNFNPLYKTTQFYIAATQNDPNVTDVEVERTADPTKNYAAVSLYTYAYTSFGSGLIDVSNGNWATNGIPAGATVSGSSYIDNFLIQITSYTVGPGTNYMYWDTPKWQ